MTTQSTPLLGLALPITGELSGTWGDTVNNSLTSLVDSAIAGMATVNLLSSSQALTSTALVANEARSAILKFTTSFGSAAFSVYAPPKTKTYVVWNATTAPITLYNSTVIGNTTAAGTGVTIPTGSRAILFTDGTNFYGIGSAQASNSITTATIITPTNTTPQFNVTALASATSIYPPPAGIDGQRLVLRILDNGTSQSISWVGGYRPIAVTLPSATVAGKLLYVALIYNAQYPIWDVVSVVIES